MAIASLKRTLAALACITALAGCAQFENTSVLGGLGGAAIGGLACAVSGANTTECALLIAGGAASAYGVAKFIDARDRATYDQAVRQAMTLSPNDFAARTPVVATSPETSNKFTYTPISETLRDGRPCRAFNVNYNKAGQDIVQQETYCQRPDNTWIPADKWLMNTPAVAASIGIGIGVGTSGSVSIGISTSPRAASSTRSAAPIRMQQIAPVFVPLTPAAPIQPRNGGASIVLLSPSEEDAERNRSVCSAMTRVMDVVTPQEIGVGASVVTPEQLMASRIAPDGTRELLRPTYWLTRSETAAEDANCLERVADFDFARAAKVRAKYNLLGRGPYILLIREDNAAAALVDLDKPLDDEVALVVQDFHVNFSRRPDVWANVEVARAEVGPGLPQRLSDAFASVIRPVGIATGACSLDLFTINC